MSDAHRALVAHLFRRAGFGLRSADARQFPLDDYEAVVDALLNPRVAQRDDHPLAAVAAVGDATVVDVPIAIAQAEWMRSMVETTTPLVERMTLFLANHFATALTGGVDAVSLMQQQATIRKHALGNFAELTHAMIDDLALGRFLNNDFNRKGRPNENLGRELMELFLLGPGNFTEGDVKEVSRSLTGYAVFSAPAVQPQMFYDEKRHDNGQKTVLGVTHNFTPHGVVDLLLAQPAAKRFIATKLVTTFVSASPDPSLIDAVAKALRGWEITPALRTIFLSPQFRGDAARLALPKTPAEYIVGIMRGLRRNEYTEGVTQMSAAGHTLYRPPSVAGWPMGKAMLGTGSMLARYNAAAYFASLHAKKRAVETPPGDDLAAWMNEFGLTALSPTTRDALASYRRSAARQSTASRTAGLLTLLLSSPEFHLA